METIKMPSIDEHYQAVLDSRQKKLNETQMIPTEVQTPAALHAIIMDSVIKLKGMYEDKQIAKTGIVEAVTKLGTLVMQTPAQSQQPKQKEQPVQPAAQQPIQPQATQPTAQQPIQPTQPQATQPQA